MMVKINLEQINIKRSAYLSFKLIYLFAFFFIISH